MTKETEKLKQRGRVSKHNSAITTCFCKTNTCFCKTYKFSTMSKCKLFVDVEDRKDSNPLKQNQEKMISTTSRNFPFKSSSKNNVRGNRQSVINTITGF